MLFGYKKGMMMLQHEYVLKNYAKSKKSITMTTNCMISFIGKPKDGKKVSG
jgi:hypothetical protein